MTFNRLIEVITCFYNLKPDDVCGRQRKKNLVRARQVICYFARKRLKQSYPLIGKRLGDRDHTTIIYSSRKIEGNLGKDKVLKLEIEIISKLLKERDRHLKEYFSEKEHESFVKVKAKEEKQEENLLRKFQKISVGRLLPEHIRRQRDVLQKYEDGWTFADIARKYNLTRERIRQITTRALLYRAKEIFHDKVDPDLKKFFVDKKEKHLERTRERYGFVQKKDLVKKEKRWSKNYDYCRKCATNSIKHHSYGYCKKCFPTTKIFKDMQKASRLRNIKKRKAYVSKYSREYHKRPEVIARFKEKENLKYFGGNREKAILRDGKSCRQCGLSRRESYGRYGKDLFVLHIGNKKDNRLENLITLCSKCFSSTVIKRVIKKVGKK